MPYHPAPELSSAGDFIDRAADLSHYASRLLAAEPRLRSDTPVDHAFTAEEMRAVIASLDGGGDGDLERGLRELRKRVMLNLIARDLAGAASRAIRFNITRLQIGRAHV